MKKVYSGSSLLNGEVGDRFKTKIAIANLNVGDIVEITKIIKDEYIFDNGYYEIKNLTKNEQCEGRFGLFPDYFEPICIKTLDEWEAECKSHVLYCEKMGDLRGWRFLDDSEAPQKGDYYWSSAECWQESCNYINNRPQSETTKPYKRKLTDQEILVDNAKDNKVNDKANDKIEKENIIKIKFSDDAMKLIDGFEPVEFRIPKEGEWFLTGSGCAMKCTGVFSVPRFILKKKYKYKWPPFLKGWGFVKQSNGVILHCVYPHSIKGDYWDGNGSYHINNLLSRVDFEPPVIDDWRVPVLNPNYKE